MVLSLPYVLYICVPVLSNDSLTDIYPYELELYVSANVSNTKNWSFNSSVKSSFKYDIAVVFAVVWFPL